MSRPRGRQCGARGFRYAAESMRRWFRPSAPDRRWSALSAARRSPDSRCAHGARRNDVQAFRALRNAEAFPWGATRQLPQAILPWGREPEVFVRTRGGDAAPRRPVEKASLNEERLVDVLDGVFLFVKGGGQA